MITGSNVRRIAAHTVVLENGSSVKMGVVTLLDGWVQSVESLRGEAPMTEWLGGEIVVRKGRAYWNGKRQ